MADCRWSDSLVISCSKGPSHVRQPTYYWDTFIREPDYLGPWMGVGQSQIQRGFVWKMDKKIDLAQSEHCDSITQRRKCKKAFCISSVVRAVSMGRHQLLVREDIRKDLYLSSIIPQSTRIAVFHKNLSDIQSVPLIMFPSCI